MSANPFDRPDDIDSTAVTGLLAVGLSGLVSILTRPALGDSIRIRWSVGTYYGPEVAPATLVLAAFPVVAGGTFLALELLGRHLERTGALDASRTVYEASVLATLGTLLLAQVSLIVANLLL